MFYTTTTDIEQMIRGALGTDADDFDIPAISRDLRDEDVLAEVHNEYGYFIGWEDRDTDEGEAGFWAIVERHAR